MKRTFVAVLSAVLLLGAGVVHAAPAPFYEGKTLRLTVGTTPGGGFDAWARLISRHLGKHIPGNPTVIVENMPGAGGLIQVNNLYAATKPDGLTMGYILGSILLTQALGEPGYSFDPQKFIYVGAPNKENIVLILSKKAGVTAVDKWRSGGAPVVKVGALARGSSVENFARVLKEVLGFPIQVVSGYKGTTEVRLAVESGELGGGPPSLDSARTSWKGLLDKGDATVAVLGAPKAIKELPNVPPANRFARNDEERRIVQIVLDSQNEYSRPLVLPPGTPKDRVQILRQAFDETVKDPEFLAEVEKMKMTLDPASGDEVTNEVTTLTKIDASLRAKLRKILFD